MKIAVILVAVALIFGCCGPVTPAACSGSTFDSSCKKSCNALMSEEDLGFSYNDCVSECREVLESEGFDPDSCCESDMQVRQVCVIDCSDPDSIYGPQNCMENCLQSVEMFTGLGPNDCVVPY